MLRVCRQTHTHTHARNVPDWPDLLSHHNSLIFTQHNEISIHFHKLHLHTSPQTFSHTLRGGGGLAVIIIKMSMIFLQGSNGEAWLCVRVSSQPDAVIPSIGDLQEAVRLGLMCDMWAQRRARLRFWTDKGNAEFKKPFHYGRGMRYLIGYDSAESHTRTFRIFLFMLCHEDGWRRDQRFWRGH